MLRRLRLLGCCLFLVSSFAGADDAPSGTDANDQPGVEQTRQQRMRRLVDSYEVFCDEDATRPAKLREEPIFRWSNPERAAIAGDMYLWTNQGRPHATIGIWTYDDVKDSHELQSLAVSPFIARGSLYSDWRPSAPGVEFRRVETQLAPATSAALRLGQMRQVARERFVARMTKNSGSVEELRLIPQPLYRYDECPDGVIDGAMFAYAVGTDPEVLLIMEVREGESGHELYAAFGSATSNPAEGDFDGESIWSNAAERSKGTFVMYILN